MRFVQIGKTSSKLDLQTYIPERPAGKVLYKLTLYTQALDCEIMHFRFLRWVLPLETLNSTSPLPEKKKKPTSNPHWPT